jgi:hypothetical protein
MCLSPLLLAVTVLPIRFQRHIPLRDIRIDRSGTTFFGREAKNNTIQTQRRTISLYKNSPVRFHAIGSVDMLHLTTPGVEKKNDHVIANVPIPTNELQPRPRPDALISAMKMRTFQSGFEQWAGQQWFSWCQCNSIAHSIGSVNRKTAHDGLAVRIQLNAPD